MLLRFYDSEGLGLFERLIHLLAADSVVSAFLPAFLPASLLPGQFFVIVPFDPDPNHARFVHNLLDDFAIFANDFACCKRNIWIQVTSTIERI